MLSTAVVPLRVRSNGELSSSASVKSKAFLNTCTKQYLCVHTQERFLSILRYSLFVKTAINLHKENANVFQWLESSSLTSSISVTKVSSTCRVPKTWCREQGTACLLAAQMLSYSHHLVCLGRWWCWQTLRQLCSLVLTVSLLQPPCRALSKTQYQKGQYSLGSKVYTFCFVHSLHGLNHDILMQCHNSNTTAHHNCAAFS